MLPNRTLVQNHHLIQAKGLILKLILCIACLAVSQTAPARISLGAISFDDEEELYLNRNAALMRQALLKANGKQWFIKHIISAVDYPFIMLYFVYGNYCLVDKAIVENPDFCDEFYSGIKKGIYYLSDKNKTLYRLDRSDYDSLYDTNYILSEVQYLANQKKCNFDGYDGFSEKTEPICISIDLYFFGYLWNIIIRDKLFDKNKELKSKIDTLLECITDGYEITDPKDTELIFQLIQKIDKYILSIPVPADITVMFPWDYTARKHE